MSNSIYDVEKIEITVKYGNEIGVRIYGDNDKVESRDLEVTNKDLAYDIMRRVLLGVLKTLNEERSNMDEQFYGD